VSRDCADHYGERGHAVPRGVRPKSARSEPRAAALYAAALFLTALMLSSRAEAATSCPAASRPAKVTVTPLLPAPREDHATSYHDLTKEMSWKKMKPEEDAMGVSSSSLGYELQSEFKLETRGSRSCAYLTSLAVRFGYTRRLVQIAAEVPKNSCMYGEIREHEYKHVAVDDRILRDNFAAVTADIQNFAAAYGPIETYDGMAANRKLAGALKAVLRPVLGHLNELANAAQEKVDSEAEYERVGNACRTIVDTSKPETAALAPAPAPSTPSPPPLKPDGK
jgi:hypothetical protein